MTEAATMTQVSPLGPMLDDDRTTLGEVRAWLRARVLGDRKPQACPVCRQRVEVYARTIHSAMARFLIGMHRPPSHLVTADRWVHVPSLAREVPALRISEGGDNAKCRYWGLVELATGPRPDGSRNTGYMRITEQGHAFVRGDLRVIKTALIYDDRFLAWDDDSIMWGIRDALGRKFDYDVLMRESEGHSYRSEHAR
jgi:hypothetical protein